MKLSIIIPVYNSEKYLQKCLESVFGQDLPFSDYEVIVINDGSQDESKNIILHFKNQFKNLLLIDQPNLGVSAARNAGLAIAKGAYITFIDSDDYIKTNTLKTIVSHLENYTLDILYCNIEIVHENGDHISHFPATGIQGEIADGFSHPRRTYPAVFYKTDLIKGLKFHQGISIGEDSLFNAMAQSFAQRVSYFATPFYHYRDTPNSLSSSSDNARKVQEMYIALSELLDFKNENFKNGSENVIKYFEEVAKIFITRIVQWGILSNVERKRNFVSLHRFVQGNKLSRLLDDMAVEYPFINRSYQEFYFLQKGAILKKALCQKLFFGKFKV